MRISLNWLQELVELTINPEELAKTLTIAGFEVESMEDRRLWANGVVIGKVLERQKHPNADKLSVCTVDIGQEIPANIVCGAPNVKAEIFVAVATLGTYLPNIDLKIKPAKLRGVPSEGMICSLAELGLQKESEGIYIFTQDNLEVGQDVRPLLGLDDVILDLTATANRADALSMIGVAREVAALTGGKLKLPQVCELTIPEGDLKLDITEQQANPAYIGTVIEGVKIAPSPDWLKNRLTAAGIRPINNVVDVTNYILLEWGQPLHAFDREKLQSIAGKETISIGVRFAQPQETLITLDDQTRTLNPENLLITANNHPIALAGVMGGAATEVDSNTQNIVLEAALFNSVTIRRSSRSQGLSTEAAIRYQRGVNQAEFKLAASRAITMIREIAGGTAISQVIWDNRGEETTWSHSIQLRLSRIQEILGPIKQGNTITQIAASDVERILTDLGCQLQPVENSPKVWLIKVPPYRYRDLEREIDLIEEVARLYGYDHFCDELPNKTQPGYLSIEEKTRRTIREAIRGVGLTEVVHYSLVKPTGVEIVINNPLYTEYSALRTNLIDGLIDAFEYNLSQGNGALNGFEIGRIFQKSPTGLDEFDAVSGIMGGELLPEGIWTKSGKPIPMTWYEAKGMLETVFTSLGICVEYQADNQDSRLHPGRTASLWIGKQRLGIFGQLHPQLLSQKDLPEAVYVFELSFDVLLSALTQATITRPLFQAYSTYPGVQRDIAFFAPLKVSVGDIQKTITKAGGNLLAEVELFDQYKGKGVPENERSLAFSLVYKVSDRTLTDAEIEPIHQKIRDSLVTEFAVTLRS